MISSDTLLAGAVVCLILLTVAVALLAGLWLGRKQQPAQQESLADSDRLADVINGLYQWTNGIARDVSDYKGAVGRLAHHFEGMQESSSIQSESGDNPLDPQMLHAFQSAHTEIQDRLAAAEAALEQQATEIEVFVNEARCDALTGVGNRRAFDEEMSRRFAEFRRYAVPLCVVMVDLDHFKQVNDVHGHPAGDAVLTIAAERLQEAMRTSDIVTRYGGEEFAVILVQTGLPDSRHAAERARRAIESQPFEFEDKELRLTASCGVAQAIAEESVGSLIQRADSALYAAKDAGRNAAYWHDGHDCLPITESRIELEARPVRSPTEPLPEKLATACNDLRARLGEISRGTAP